LGKVLLVVGLPSWETHEMPAVAAGHPKLAAMEQEVSVATAEMVLRQALRGHP
jgi:hypothetical protein